MIDRRSLIVLLLLSQPGCTSAPLAPPVSVPKMPRQGTVVLLGDSTTWHNVYPALLESTFLRKHPRHRLRFVNRGRRSDTVASALARLHRDVIAHDPTMVIVLLGINDGGYGRPNRRLLRSYLDRMQQLVERLGQHTRAQIVLVTTTCVAPVNYDARAYNRMLAAMAQGLVQLGQRLRVPVIDLFSHFHAKVQAAPPLALMADHNHPNTAGYVVVARYLLRFFARPGATINPPGGALYTLLQRRWRLQRQLWDPDRHRDKKVSTSQPARSQVQAQLAEVRDKIEALRGTP